MMKSVVSMEDKFKLIDKLMELDGEGFDVADEVKSLLQIMILDCATKEIEFKDESKSICEAWGKELDKDDQRFWMPKW
jgi:uncharacterized protein Smg (DUF494 family)